MLQGRWWVAVCGALVCLFSASCSGGTQTAGELKDSGANARTAAPLVQAGSAAKLTPALAQQAAIPSLDRLDALRSDSALKETLLSGSELLEGSPGAEISGSAIVLDATASGPRAGAASEWALYSFSPQGQPLDSLQVLLDNTVAQGAYIGLANYALNRWDWSGPYTDIKTLSIDGGNYLSAADNFYCLVLAAPGSKATVSALSIRSVKADNLAPFAVIGVNVPGGPAPLVVEFNSDQSGDLDGQIIEYAWDFNGDGLYETFSDGQPITKQYLVHGDYLVHLRVTDNDFAQSSDQISIYIHLPVEGPQARFSPEELQANIPFRAHFDAKDSLPGIAGGSIVKYEWDWEGDGSYDSISTAPTVTHEYSATGEYSPTLRVTDNNGFQAKEFHLLRCFSIASTLVAAEGNVGWDCCMLDVNGKPAICHFDSDSYEMWFVRALDSDGSEWGSPVLLATGAGGDLSMALVNGLPAIAYRDGSPLNKLCYIRALDVDGSSWASPVTVDASGTRFPSLSEIAGQPAITYLGGDYSEIRYVRSDDALGSSWPAPQMLEAHDDPGYNYERKLGTLEVVNGKPALSYYSYPARDLNYLQANDALGTSWGPAVSVDAAGDTGHDSSLKVVDGYPAISYNDAIKGDLRYVRALDSDGVTWNVPITVDSTGPGFNPALTVFNGRATISYYDLRNNDLRWVYAFDDIGSSWEPPFVIDAVNDCGLYSSMSVSNAHVAIAYISYKQYFGSGDLRYIQLY